MKRNRAQTEQRILQAARELIIESGFTGFGINHVATRSGADKVLIYRYFDGINGLMDRLARETEFYPPPSSLFPTETTTNLNTFVANYHRSMRERPLTLVLLAWKDAVNNPMTSAVKLARQTFWSDVARFSQPHNTPSLAFLRCLPSLLEDGVSSEEILVTLKAFNYSPYIPEEERKPLPEVETPATSSKGSADLPTNLL